MPQKGARGAKGIRMKPAIRHPQPKMLLSDLRQLIAEARQDVARSARRVEIAGNRRLTKPTR